MGKSTISMVIFNSFLLVITRGYGILSGFSYGFPVRIPLKQSMGGIDRLDGTRLAVTGYGGPGAVAVRKVGRNHKNPWIIGVVKGEIYRNPPIFIIIYPHLLVKIPHISAIDVLQSILESGKYTKCSAKHTGYQSRGIIYPYLLVKTMNWLKWLTVKLAYLASDWD